MRTTTGYSLSNSWMAALDRKRKAAYQYNFLAQLRRGNTKPLPQYLAKSTR